VITITVYGNPAPQGSKRHVGGGIMIESSAAVKPWRTAVEQAVMLAYPFGLRKDAILVRGPVCLEVTFTKVRPKSAKKSVVYPASSPDLSKLVRSTEDALTTAGVWEDDSRVVWTQSRKLYTGHPEALPVAGAVITVWEER
jgi:crossover junction endodeoxyribonuclease RusA